MADAVLEVAAVGAINQNKKLKKQLASATCALLGSLRLASAGESEGWNVDSSILYYSEDGDRVSAIEPVIKLKKNFGEEREAEIKFVLDALTGATPNGATVSTSPQTFTRPSGSGSYVVQPGKTPLDDTFKDTRIAVSGAWTQPLSKLMKGTVGLNFSKEYDFLSMGANASIARDFNEKNSTLSFGLSVEQDQIDPVGGVPIPFSPMGMVGAAQPRRGGSETKSVYDAILGLTQIINPRTLMQFNYSLGQSDGYLNDPYKLITQINPTTGNRLYLFENRPDTRLKHAVYWLTRYHLKRDIVSGSYRYYFDDWGVTSHTVDLNYHWKFAAKQFLEPRVRFYQQSEADFFRTQLLTTEATPAEASADYRLAKFDGLTLGFKWGMTVLDDSLLALRLEYYTQKGDSSFPDLKATIAQVQFSF